MTAPAVFPAEIPLQPSRSHFPSGITQPRRPRPGTPSRRAHPADSGAPGPHRQGDGRCSPSWARRENEGGRGPAGDKCRRCLRAMTVPGRLGERSLRRPAGTPTDSPRLQQAGRRRGRADPGPRRHSGASPPRRSGAERDAEGSPAETPRPRRVPRPHLGPRGPRAGPCGSGYRSRPHGHRRPR